MPTCTQCGGWGYLLFASLNGPDEALDREPCEDCQGER